MRQNQFSIASLMTVTAICALWMYAIFYGPGVADPLVRFILLCVFAAFIRLLMPRHWPYAGYIATTIAGFAMLTFTLIPSVR